MLLGLFLAILSSACSDASREGRTAAPRLPAGHAGEILSDALQAAGGWERWSKMRDVSYISTLTILNRARQLSTESVGLYTAPLHAGARARMDSIGLPTRVQFGIDGEESWIFSEGEPITEPGQVALSRFDMVSSLFWFSLPFALAELPAAVTDVGPASEDGKRWNRLKAVFDEPNPAVPGRWFVLYLDAETDLIDRVHAQLTAPFLRHEIWVGKWLQYGECGGFRKERQRQFFPADLDAKIVGDMVAEQFIEHVEFNRGFPPSHWARPGADPGRRAGESSPGGNVATRGIAMAPGAHGL
jgi:hypothetical protein